MIKYEGSVTRVKAFVLCMLLLLLIMICLGSFTYTTTIAYDGLIRPEDKVYVTVEDLTLKSLVVETWRWPWDEASCNYTLIKDYSDENLTVVTDTLGNLTLKSQNGARIVFQTSLLINTLTIDSDGVIDLRSPVEVGQDITLGSNVSIQ